MSITMTTLTVAPRPWIAPRFALLCNSRGAGAMWRTAVPTFAGRRHSADPQLNPIYTRDRAVVAAKQGSPPRGVER